MLDIRVLSLSIVIVVSTLFGVVSTEFTADFQNWLYETYGPDVQATLTRPDLGKRGSFGGKLTRDEVVINHPVILVHGVSTVAGDKMFAMARYLNKKGYRWSELYGTTYASGDQGNPLQWSQYTMECLYVKQVRALIVAVRQYTGRSVDVIAYSLGVPISRKAILGGYCVDTGEYLGNPLTRFVDTFVGVAGPNHGISLKLADLSVPACALALLPICNLQTGLYSGICPIESSFLKDINAYGRYEGNHVFTIYSKADQLVGYKICNHITSRIPGQNGEKVYPNKNHSQVFDDSFEVQRQMITNHNVL